MALRDATRGTYAAGRRKTRDGRRKTGNIPPNAGRGKRHSAVQEQKKIVTDMRVPYHYAARTGGEGRATRGGFGELLS